MTWKWYSKELQGLMLASWVVSVQKASPCGGKGEYLLPTRTVVAMESIGGGAGGLVSTQHS